MNGLYLWFGKKKLILGLKMECCDLIRERFWSHYSAIGVCEVLKLALFTQTDQWDMFDVYTLESTEERERESEWGE